MKKENRDVDIISMCDYSAIGIVDLLISLCVCILSNATHTVHTHNVRYLTKGNIIFHFHWRIPNQRKKVKRFE